MAFNPYEESNCFPTSPYSCSSCWVKEDGRIRSVFFVSNTYTFTNISSSAEWLLQINCPGNPTGPIFIVPYTQGSLAITPKEDNSFGSVDKEVSSFEYVLTIKDPNILTALPWWNQMSATHSFNAGFRTQTSVFYSGAGSGPNGTLGGGNVVEIIPTYSVDDDVQSRVLISVVIKWIQAAGSLAIPNPTPGYTTGNPDGIFNGCYTC